MDQAPGTCGLGDLATGECATVARVDHDAPVGRRLMAMGVMPGCRLRVVGRAPLGDPMMVELPGNVVCLRRRDAQSVAVAR